MSRNLDLANCLPGNERKSEGNERKLACDHGSSLPIERVFPNSAFLRELSVFRSKWTNSQTSAHNRARNAC